MPWCRLESGSVRASRMAQSAVAAPLVHTFCPVTTHSSPSRTARVRRLARSDPASGSENSWHHRWSPWRMAGRNRRCCSGVPNAISVGPTIRAATWNGPAGTAKRVSSSRTMRASLDDRPRPPSSAGQVGTLQPPSASVRCQARAVAANWGVSTSRRWRVARPYGAACSSMKARTSARRAASAGVSSAPFGRSLRLLTVRPRSWWVRG